MTLAGNLATLARSLLRSTTPEQRRRLAHALTGPALRDWTYVPGARAGLLMGDVDRSQRQLVHMILGQVLSEPCHAQLAVIMAMEDVLDRREGHGRDRHATDFWVLVFGEPGADGIWSVRLEGHHVCVHVTVSGEEVVVAPLFLGCNPAVIRRGERIITAPLWHEEELARDVLAAVPPTELGRVRPAREAPADIYTRDLGQVPPSFPPAAGVPITELDRSARELLELYAGRLAGPLGSDLLDRLLADDLRFSWEGATEPGRGHYYRLAGTRFVIEYDNTQNGANHIHSVLRDREADFGGDVLAVHTAAESG
jgi:Protein of unknown function (DUF3500)